ncbi:MAG: dihydroxyacetone kinase subunit DhaK [Cloacibacillus evryensis]
MATIAVACRATRQRLGRNVSDVETQIGMGQHGEGGGGRMTMKSARETAAIMTQALLDDLSIEKGEEVMLIVNGSGATTLMEQLIVFKDCVEYLKDKGVKVAASHVGELLTVQEAAGFQLFMARMDDEMMKYWKAPCDTPYYTVK